MLILIKKQEKKYERKSIYDYTCNKNNWRGDSKKFFIRTLDERKHSQTQIETKK
jgi:hypothetical protein